MFNCCLQFHNEFFLGGRQNQTLYWQQNRKFRLDYKDILHCESSQILYEVIQKCCGLHVLGKVRILLNKAPNSLIYEVDTTLIQDFEMNCLQRCLPIHESATIGSRIQTCTVYLKAKNLQVSCLTTTQMQGQKIHE